MKLHAGDRVLVSTAAWSQAAIQRLRIEAIRGGLVQGIWETGELEGKEASFARDQLEQLVRECLPSTWASPS